VIPLFAAALLDGKRPVVHGDGQQSRDFTFISDVVAANLAAAGAPAAQCAGRVFNIAAGASSSLLDILTALGALLGVEPDPEFVETRAGDVRHSRADASAAARDLGFHAEVALADGLLATVDWIKQLS
jgi:nucleoside-diphosphate-sugar epimerase